MLEKTAKTQGKSAQLHSGLFYFFGHPICTPGKTQLQGFEELRQNQTHVIRKTQVHDQTPNFKNDAADFKLGGKHCDSRCQEPVQ